MKGKGVVERKRETKHFTPCILGGSQRMGVKSFTFWAFENRSLKIKNTETAKKNNTNSTNYRNRLMVHFYLESFLPFFLLSGARFG